MPLRRRARPQLDRPWFKTRLRFEVGGGSPKTPLLLSFYETVNHCVPLEKKKRSFPLSSWRLLLSIPQTSDS